MFGFGKDITQDGQYFSIDTPLGKDKLILREFQGEEGISQPFYYRLKMVADDEGLSFDRVIGKKATVTVTVGEDEDKRYISGIITHFELTFFDEREELAYYEAELRPWLWLLTLSGDCRIFQKKSVPEIVEAVCKDAGYPHVKKSLSATYKKREYCVQYGETDFNFVSRLLEEEGIFYFFKHSKTKCEMVLGDGSSAFKKTPFIDELNYRSTRAYDTEDNYLTQVRYTRQVTTKTVGLDSFNFERPSTDLYAKAQGAKGVGTLNSYHVGHTKSKDGEKYAKILMQAAAAPGELVRGAGRARSLVAGFKFKIKEHPRKALNQEYVAQRLRISATRSEYGVQFEAIPSSKPFRPRGTATKPRIHSSQTALVVGKKNEEIWTDKYGRVKVQFHWDRQGKKDEKSSCWIRVSQNWAGKSYGMMFLPRVGMEVIVSFLDGDPDQPIVTGAIYNGEQKVPYALPKNSTVSTIKTQSSKKASGKFNEIKFEDKKDKELIYVHAQKDMKVDVLHDLTRTIKNDLKQTIEKNMTTTVKKKNHSVTIKEGNDTLKVEKGTRSVSVKKKETHKNEDAFEHTVKKDYTLKIDGNLTITVSGDVKVKGKSMKFETTSKGVNIKSAKVVNVKAGTAFQAEAKQQAVVKGGTALNLTAGTKMNAKAKTGVVVDSSTTMALKSKLTWKAEGLKVSLKGKAMGELDGGGMAKVKGGMIKLG